MMTNKALHGDWYLGGILIHSNRGDDRVIKFQKCI